MQQEHLFKNRPTAQCYCSHLSDESNLVLGVGYVFLLCHSLSFPYDYYLAQVENYIMQTRPCYLDHIESQVLLVNLGFTGIYIFFFLSLL